MDLQQKISVSNKNEIANELILLSAYHGKHLLEGTIMCGGGFNSYESLMDITIHLHNSFFCKPMEIFSENFDLDILQENLEKYKREIKKQFPHFVDSEDKEWRANVTVEKIFPFSIDYIFQLEGEKFEFNQPYVGGISFLPESYAYHAIGESRKDMLYISSTMVGSRKNLYDLYNQITNKEFSQPNFDWNRTFD